MVNLITLKGSRLTPHKLLFSKKELTKILNAYSNGVIKDHWRDYAIDQTGKISIFSIFRNSREKATYCITKRREKNKKLERFSLEYRLRTVEVSSNLDKILKRLENRPKLLKNWVGSPIKTPTSKWKIIWYRAWVSGFSLSNCKITPVDIKIGTMVAQERQISIKRNQCIN